MSLALLDGTAATVDLSVGGLSGTSGSSLRCIINAMEYSSRRGFQSTKVLCSGKWESESPGTNQDFVRITKFASQGAVISDLSPLMTATAASSLTATFASGCTKIGTFWASDDTINVAAGIVAMPGDFVMRSKDAVATTWVTS